MKLTNLTFIVTDDCNLNCSYCVQKKEKNTITSSIIDRALDFFHPFLSSDEPVLMGFYGGEPLLAYEQVKHAVAQVKELNKRRSKGGDKAINFSLTTNGLLLTDEMLAFFESHRFSLTLSFDGLAQEKGRRRGTLEKMIGLVKRIREYGGIHFEINSVFSPGTVHLLSGSMRFMIEPGGPDITFNLSTMEEWPAHRLAVLKKELDKLSDYLRLYYKKTGKIPVKNFQSSGGAPKAGVFRCSAGGRNMAVTPEGHVWGCFLFHDYFKTRKKNSQYGDYFFGALADFIDNFGERYPVVAANYAELRQDYFNVEGAHCFLCGDVESCMVCPVNAAYATGSIGKISCGNCQLIKIQKNARKKFQTMPPAGMRRMHPLANAAPFCTIRAGV